jgi:FkbM family methyltransferase
MSGVIDTFARFSRSLPPVRGRGAVAQLAYRFAKPSSGIWHIDMADGSRMLVPKSTASTWVAAFSGSYDDEFLALIRPYLTPGTFSIDVGACFGFYAIRLGRWAPVLSFEPLLGNVEILLRNAALNRIPALTVMNFGLSDEATQVRMDTEQHGIGNGAIHTGGAPGLQASAIVETRPLDRVELPEALSQLRCTVVKLDVEGYEMNVLRGAQAFIERHRPVIFGEFSRWWFNERGIGPEALPSWAAAHRYELFELAKRRVSRFSDRHSIAARPLMDSDRLADAVLLLPSEGAPNSLGSEA